MGKKPMQTLRGTSGKAASNQFAHRYFPATLSSMVIKQYLKKKKKKIRCNSVHSVINMNNLKLVTNSMSETQSYAASCK